MDTGFSQGTLPLRRAGYNSPVSGGPAPERQGASPVATAVEGTDSSLTPLCDRRVAETRHQGTQTDARDLVDAATEQQAARLAGLPRQLQHQLFALKDQLMVSCLYHGEPVGDCALLDHMARRNLELDCRSQLTISRPVLRDHLQAQDSALRQRLLDSLPEETLVSLLGEPSLVPLLIAHCPRLFGSLPQRLRTAPALRQFLKALPENSRRPLWPHIERWHPDLLKDLESMEEAIRRDPRSACRRRADELTPDLRRQAVAQHHLALTAMETLPDPEYDQLCHLALQQSGRALGSIRADRRSGDHVDHALANNEQPLLNDIPPELYTRERLHSLLERAPCAPHANARNRLSCALFDQYQLWDILKSKPGWLHALPENERTRALCGQYFHQFPVVEAFELVPAAVLARHPHWLAAFASSTACQPLYKHCLTPRVLELPVLQAVVDSRPCHRFGSLPLDENKPAWETVSGPLHDHREELSLRQLVLLLNNGGTAGLGQAFDAPPLVLDKGALLDPAQEGHCSRRAFRLPELARQKLTFCHHFQLPREEYGQRLCQQMDRHTLATARQLASRTLPVWQPGQGDAAWQLRGSRTLVQDAADDRCRHMKFQRKGETLARFTAEEAVQRFAREHHKVLGFRSELPEPEGLVFVPEQDLPRAARSFAHTLEMRNDQGSRGCLAFCFYTESQDYDTPAWHDDNQGSFEQGRAGLMRAFHDLGIWSSMGALHTSTARMFHTGDELRPALVLNSFFEPGRPGFPAALHLWNSRTLEQSAWGRSGLRDLGKLEFYPFVTSYVEAPDACPIAPDYGQRASFVNAIAQNILAGLLHVMRACREQADYRYDNPVQVRKMADCIREACDSLLGSLLGDGTRLASLFPDQATCEDWQWLAAREVIYWTARQDPDADPHCFAWHLNKTGRPSPDLYPGHPGQANLRYDQGGFQDADGDNLGPKNGFLPLFFLVRGFYVMAMGLADRLAPACCDPQPPAKPMAS